MAVSRTIPEWYNKNGVLNRSFPMFNTRELGINNLDTMIETGFYYAQLPTDVSPNFITTITLWGKTVAVGTMLVNATQIPNPDYPTNNYLIKQTSVVYLNSNPVTISRTRYGTVWSAWTNETPVLFWTGGIAVTQSTSATGTMLFPFLNFSGRNFLLNMSDTVSVRTFSLVGTMVFNETYVIVGAYTYPTSTVTFLIKQSQASEFTLSVLAGTIPTNNNLRLTKITLLP